VQSNGVVTEEVDTLRAPGLPALRLWHSSTIEVGEVMTSAPCAAVVPGNNASFVTLGGPYVVFGGYQLGALKKGKHGVREVLSTYPASGGTAHEKDTIAASSHLWKASEFVVKGGAYNGYALSETKFHYTQTKQLVTMPALGRCG
jgi:hypothetical protein